MPQLPHSSFTDRAKEALWPQGNDILTPTERLGRVKKFLAEEEEELHQRHINGAGGLEIARARSALLDALLVPAFWQIRRHLPANNQVALVATGGYGRGELNPGSDVDLLFLTGRSSSKLAPALEKAIEEILYLLWDTGFRVGHAVRSVSECIQLAREDYGTATALMTARFLVGHEVLAEKLMDRQAQEIARHQGSFITDFLENLRRRHDRYSNTPFLQEPNVKESCGGLRDLHSILWLLQARYGKASLSLAVKHKVFPKSALAEIEAAHDFLLRVRNELHYQATSRRTDILTLELQGTACTSFGYPQSSLLLRIETFMRDYYRHARNLYQNALLLSETSQVESEKSLTSEIRSYLALGRRKRQKFDLFTSYNGRILPQNNQIFQTEPAALMRLFQHCQLRHLRLSPSMRKLVTAAIDQIDPPFQADPANRETFLAILSRKGDVARTLRQMHRAGFLGRYLPEFGALDCLVQHEFFHRYTADEHTLRFIDAMDALLDTEAPGLQRYRDILIAHPDPAALYLAILLHDAGRAENTGHHEKASVTLALRLCERLEITGSTRETILFLIEHHLALYRCATTRNIDDPLVIADFAALCGTPQRLRSLLLFTYGDSSALGPDSWTSWKETILLQLYRATDRYLTEGKDRYEAVLRENKAQLLQETLAHMPKGSGTAHNYEKDIHEHFERMPQSYFNSRDPLSVSTHIQSIHEFLQREKHAGEEFYCIGRSIDYPQRGYTELVLVTRNRPHFLERACLAIAAEGINILSADIHTRSDQIVLDIFRLCTTDFEPLNDPRIHSSILRTLHELCQSEDYNPVDYLRPRRNFLTKSTIGKAAGAVKSSTPATAFPAYARIRNDLDFTATVIEIQAIDRIGLLHDLFRVINQVGLDTLHARISTEKGAALNTFYITYPGGGQVTDQSQLDSLQTKLNLIL